MNRKQLRNMWWIDQVEKMLRLPGPVLVLKIWSKSVSDLKHKILSSLYFAEAIILIIMVKTEELGIQIKENVHSEVIIPKKIKSFPKFWLSYIDIIIVQWI